MGRPIQNEAFTETVRAIDLNYVIWNDFCVIISLALCDPDRVWMCVCVCVLGDDASLFISDPSYATQVIQHAGPREGYTLESVDVYVCVH